MDTILEDWLLKTAWPMEQASPFSWPYLPSVLFGIPAAMLLAWIVCKTSCQFRLRLLFGLGLFLAAAELYKQLFLYYIVNGRQYDWWYFPFQLCSIPIYLCLLLPLCRRALRKIIYTFLLCYNLLGAFLVFADPSGLFHPYLVLTLHSYLWHLILIFIGFLLAFSKMADGEPKGFWEATALYLLCCAVATAINVLSHPFGDANMFYISPYYPNIQLVFRSIAARLGIFAGNILYIGATILGAWLLHLGYRRFFRRFSR